MNELAQQASALHKRVSDAWNAHKTSTCGKTCRTCAYFERIEHATWEAAVTLDFLDERMPLGLESSRRSSAPGANR